MWFKLKTKRRMNDVKNGNWKSLNERSKIKKKPTKKKRNVMFCHVSHSLYENRKECSRYFFFYMLL